MSDRKEALNPSGELTVTKQNRSIFRKRGRVDLVFLALVLGLLTAGLIMLFSASYAHAYYLYGNSYHFIIKQAEFAAVGVLLMWFISRVDYRILKRFHLPWIVFGLSIVMLVAVLMMPTLSEGFDYRRWIKIGSFSFQPSEIAKFAVILLFAYLMSKNIANMKTFKKGVLPYLGLLFLICILVVVEPHLSATVLIFLIGLVMMAVAGARLGWIISGMGVLGIGGFIAIYSGIVDYGRDRIMYWIDPFADASDKGYQTIQALLAIGSGGMFGRQLGESRQKYLWVPEPHNDFIFSIICEELGFIGAAVIIVAFVLLVWRGVMLASRAPDRFGSLLVVGLTFQLGIQAALNILVVTNTIPNTGISLPFFSYGGTALLMLLAQMGIILSVSRECKIIKS